MPEIAIFYGIIIRMFFKPKEHNPPHIHAEYGEYYITVSILDCTIIKGGSFLIKRIN